MEDAEDRYLKDDVELSQEEWNRETKVYQGIGYGEDKWVDEWVNEWIPVVVMR